VQLCGRLPNRLSRRVGRLRSLVSRASRLRVSAIAGLQATLKGCIGRIALLTDAVSQLEEDVTQLAYVADLPRSYSYFLSEVKRRRRYNN
jgi:hypothetical protein